MTGGIRKTSRLLSRKTRMKLTAANIKGDVKRENKNDAGKKNDLKN